MSGKVSKIRENVGAQATDANVHSPKVRDVLRADDIVRSAIVTTDRNRWFFAFCVMALLVVVLVFRLSSLSVDLATNYKVAWVKMYPDGTWDVDLTGTSDSMSYLEAQVDSVLSQWVHRRFSEKPETIRSDYGYANVFLSPRLKAHFTDAGGFNAAQRAADIRSNRGSGTVLYDVGAIDHFDRDVNAQFRGIEGIAYRTNVFFTRREYAASGAEQRKPDKGFVRIEWRLMTQEEIGRIVRQDGGIEWLRENPIGLEIISYEELDDNSDNE